MDEKIKSGKINVELKQNPKGVWYTSSLNVNADNLDEFDKLLLEASKKLKEHIGKLNAQNGKPEIKTETILDSEQLKLFQNLKELRRLLAKREGYPPYVIFHDSVLRKLALEKPRTNQELEAVIGKKRLDKYGGLITELLDRHRILF